MLNLYMLTLCMRMYVDISDKTDHDYIQVYMHPKSLGLTNIYYITYITLWLSCRL